MKKYAIHPGFVISLNDGDEHFITFTQLCDLYGLNPNDCVRWSDRAGLKEKDYIHLYPRRSGKYTKLELPVTS